MTILEKAAELGAMIRDSAEKKRLDEAAAAYNADDELISMIEKYNEHYAKVKADEESGSLREGVGEMVNQQLSAMYDVIMARPTMKEYTDANAAFDDLMQRVYSSITYQITGETGCGRGGCDGCSGCG